MTEDVTVRVSPESFAAIRDGLRELFRPDSGRKGISSIISKEEGIYAPDEMIVGVKLLCTWRRHEGYAYVYERRKPGVKATSCNSIGPIVSWKETGPGEIEILTRTTDWETGKPIGQKIMVREAEA